MKKNYLHLTVLCLLIFTSISRAQTITTIAGTGVQGYNGDNIAASIAQLNSPAYVIPDNSGNIYIADLLNHRVRKIDVNGFITTIAGTGSTAYNGDNIAATVASLYNPTAVAFDQTGNLYIADGNHSRIRKINTTGFITTLAGTGTFGFNGDEMQANTSQVNFPTDGLLVDASGNIFFSDTYNHRIRKVSPSGVISTIAGTGVAGYNGDNISAASAQLNLPYGLALDATGNLYVADGQNHRIRKISTTGVITTVAGTGVAGYNGDNIPATSATLNDPQGFAIDAAGNLYISDSYNNRIRKVNKNTGIITTVVGTGSAGYNGDNIPATSAQIRSSVSITFDAAGNLFIADLGNHRVRKVNNVGIILPLSLTSFTAQFQNGTGLLQWHTSNEINTQQFVVESSKDGVSFSAVGSVKANNTPGSNSYLFTDTKVKNGVTYYRLKMVDVDSKFTYSNILTIKTGVATISLNLYPNPAGNIANLSFTSVVASKYTVQITDLSGKIIRQQNEVSLAGTNKLTVDLHNFAAGTYTLTITTANNEKANIKFVKK